MKQIIVLMKLQSFQKNVKKKVQGFSNWSYFSRKKRQAESILSFDLDIDYFYKLKDFLKAVLQYWILIIRSNYHRWFWNCKEVRPNAMAAFQCATSPVSEPVGACAERKERYKPGSQTQLFVWRSLAGNIMGRIGWYKRRWRGNHS